MKSKIVALIVAAIFLLTHIGCTPVNKTHMQTNIAYAENPMADFEAQKKKDEREWLLMVLLVLGIGLVLGATLSVASGGGGLFVGANN